MDNNKIINAYTSLRASNQSVPDDVLDYMYNAALQHSELEEELQQLKDMDAELGDVYKKQFDENQALKAQVNALRDGMYDVAAADTRKEACSLACELLEKTPEQCLAEYRNSVIDECVAAERLMEKLKQGCKIMKKYLCFGGDVMSESDGERHYIAPTRLPSLYGVPSSECVFVCIYSRDLKAETGAYKNLIHLHPMCDGDYTLPTKGGK